MEFENTQVEELRGKDQQNAAKKKELNVHLLYEEVYSRRENLRFFAIPRMTDGPEEMGKILQKSFRDELDLENPEMYYYFSCDATKF